MARAIMHTTSKVLTRDEIVVENISASIAVKEALRDDRALIAACVKASELLASALGRGQRAFLMGNGGSAADAQHIAAELVGRYQRERAGLPVMALTANTSCLTAIGNDYCYDLVFARQLEAFARRGDVAIGISTSGNSRNVLHALISARNMGVLTIGLTGRSGGEMRPLTDVCLCVPSEETPRIQEAHILIGHILSEIVERDVFGC